MSWKVEMKMKMYTNEVTEEIKEGLFEANQLIAEYLKGEAIKKCPVASGDLRRSIDYRNLDWTGFDFVADSPYAIYVEMMTRPHIIKIKDKKALHWTTGKAGGGKDVFATEVHHPGTTAQPFMLPAVMENRDKILRKYNEVVSTRLRNASYKFTE